MVRGRDDGVDGQDRLREHEPAPAAGAGRDDGHRDRDRPADMDRRHRRELAGQPLAEVRVRRLVVARGGVDETELREQPRWGDGDQLDEQRDTGEHGDDVAPLAVLLAVPDEHPRQEDDEAAEVRDEVVKVDDAHEVGCASSPDCTLTSLGSRRACSRCQIHRPRAKAAAVSPSETALASFHNRSSPSTTPISRTAVRPLPSSGGAGAAGRGRVGDRSTAARRPTQQRGEAHPAAVAQVGFHRIRLPAGGTYQRWVVAAVMCSPSNGRPRH